jgi:hypothetical protein
MAIANGARSQIAYVPEVTWGTTPGTPAMIALPYVSFGMNLTKEVYEDDSIQADRMLRHSVHGNKLVSGPLACNYSADDFDPLLESLFNDAFTLDVLKTGTTQKSLTIEQGSLDIAQYSVYTGVVANKLTVSVPVNGLVTATFDLIGKAGTISGTALDATVTPAVASQPFFHAGGTFKEGGSTVGMLTSIEFSVDNGGAANYALGGTTAANLSIGMSKVSGTVTAYFEDASLVNKFINGTPSSLEFTLTDGVSSHTYKMGNVKYNGATKSVAGQGPILVQLPFTAQYHAADGSNVVLTRA